MRSALKGHHPVRLMQCFLFGSAGLCGAFQHQTGALVAAVLHGENKGMSHRAALQRNRAHARQFA